jgi:hypothetical protein
MGFHMCLQIMSRKTHTWNRKELRSTGMIDEVRRVVRCSWSLGWIRTPHKQKRKYDDGY